MERLSEQIIEKALSLPEGTLIAAKALLHLGNRAAIDQALSRLSMRGQLLRAGRGLYVRPITSRFGSRAPSVETLIESVATRSGETIVPSGAASANKFGLTTQVPVRNVYLTSGPSRELQLGKQLAELRHAPNRQLLLPQRSAGEAFRALLWLGPEAAEKALIILKNKLQTSEFDALIGLAPMAPNWLAARLSARGSNV